MCGFSLALARSQEASPQSSQLTLNTTEEGSSHEDYMQMAISAAKHAPEYPFGSVIVEPATGNVLATGFNRVADNPIFHGEIDAINQCALVHQLKDWSNLALYTTAEPCPMCQSAIEWCGIKNVYYGTSIPYLKTLGWNQIDIRAVEVAKRTPFRETQVIGGVLEKACNQLFQSAKVSTRHVKFQEPR